jgi:hypothetical protein
LRQSRRSEWLGRATAAAAGAATALLSAARILKVIEVSSLQTIVWFTAEMGLE